jgi:hypothetical protein
MCHINTGPMQATWLYTAIPSSLSQAAHIELTLTPPLTTRPFACRYHPQCMCVCARTDGWVRVRAGVRLQVQEAWGYTIASTEPLP